MTERRGAVATSDPRATEAAAGVLRGGGNAVDAAVTAALVLYVVEPQSCGGGGDAFLIVGGPQRPPEALDGAGALPAAMTAERLAADGLDAVPARGAKSATVPGALALLEDALARYGTLTLGAAMAPARTLAADGFEVRPTLAAAAAKAAPEIGDDPVLGPLYVPGGRPVAAGDSVRNPALAELLDEVAAGGADVLYRGEVGRAVVETVDSHGGYLTADDLAAHRTLPMAAESVAFCDRTVWELPQPTQGPAVLEALRRLDGSASGTTPVDWSAVLDAVRAGMVAAGFDPGAVVVGQGPAAASTPGTGDTTYLAVVDADGGAASLITSVFGDFGSHLGVPVLGSAIQNRATTLRMLRRHPEPGKPPTTTIPAMVTNEDGFELAIGVAGGLMQPQAQVQLLVRMLCEGMPPQAAVNSPRFKILFGGDVAVEEGHPLGEAMPDAMGRSGGPEGFGAAQVAGWHDGRLTAAADARRGGAALVLAL